MALDEQRDSDCVYEVDGFQFIVDKKFLEKVHPIKVDFSEYGFKVDCAMDFGAACSSCSTCG
jgi:Fe-S cluster assembly iron-binding protein IscA